jgi:hypothetical protein
MRQLLMTLLNGVQSAAVSFLLEGDRDDLEKRYRDIVHLSNAQVGSLSPLSFEQVVVEVKNNEVALKLLQRSTREIDMEKKRMLEGLGSATSNKQFLDLVRAARRTMPTRPDDQGIEGSLKEPIAFENSLQVEVRASAVDETMDCWRVVLSEKLNRPFYFNTVTNIGQFEPPPALNDSFVVREILAETSRTQIFKSESYEIEYSMGTSVEDGPVVATNSESSIWEDRNAPTIFANTQLDDGNLDLLLSPTTSLTAHTCVDQEEEEDVCFLGAMSSSSGAWQCSACTFMNESAERSDCEICSSRRKRVSVQLYVECYCMLSLS